MREPERVSLMLASSPSKTRRFLAVLDETVDVFCFQTFDDLKTRRDPRLARTLHGSLGQHYERLKRLNEEGAGVFIAVNAMKVGVARKIANLERVRAIWQDDDNGFQGKYPLFPSIVVRLAKLEEMKERGTLSPGDEPLRQQARELAKA